MAGMDEADFLTFLIVPFYRACFSAGIHLTQLALLELRSWNEKQA